MADNNKNELHGNVIGGTETNPAHTHFKERVFEIHVQGQLNSQWSDWFERLEVRLLENGEMILSGPIVDQAALMGILNKLSRLNLTLLAVNEVKKIDQ